jgi:hypothetical protein
MKKRNIHPIHEELINRAVMLHHDLMKAGLFATGHRMNTVVQDIGYEIADYIAKDRKIVEREQTLKIHPSHKMTKYEGTIYSGSSNERFVMMRKCKYCDGYQVKPYTANPNGVIHSRLLKPCGK